MAICSCLTGLMVMKHPTFNFPCREDGAVCLPTKGPGRPANTWTYGWTSKNGYKHIGHNHKQYAVHRLIAETFIANPHSYETVDHINRVRDDNAIHNLRFADMKMQGNNRITVLNAPDYGARKCDGQNGYRRARYSKDEKYREKCIEKSRNYYRKRRAEGWKLTRHGWVREAA